jgi:hypothetical protein
MSCHCCDDIQGGLIMVIQDDRVEPNSLAYEDLLDQIAAGQGPKRRVRSSSARTAERLRNICQELGMNAQALVGDVEDNPDLQRRALIIQQKA